jgi:hypothetical protein
MFLSAYHFDGDPATLVAAHDQLATVYPPESYSLHVCIRTEQGMTVLDGCPSREVFEEFHRSQGFRAALASAGLPTPRIEALGDVESAVINEG